MIEITNLIIGGTIFALNLIPLVFRKFKWFQITIPLSLLIAAIKVIFMVQ